jgi:hypothetical protein
MNHLPRPAQIIEPLVDLLLNVPNRTLGKPIVLSKLRWPFSAVQIKHSFAPCPNYVNVSGPVIVRINHYAESTETKSRRHEEDITTLPKRLG